MMTSLKRTVVTIVLISFSWVAFADPPPEAGVVLRFDATYLQWWYDEENDTTAYFGADPFVACSESFPAGYDLVPIMLVLMDTEGEDVLRFGRHITDDLQTSVWPGFVPPGSLCAQIRFFGLTPIASGYSYFIFNDNDGNPGLNPDRHNINSFGFNAKGILINYDSGEPMRFKMFAHALWDGIDLETFRFIVKTKLD